MFEARLAEGALFKKIIDCIKDLCKDINFDVAEDGMTVQAMDNSHVALVALRINPSAFEHYRCDRAQTIGINVEQLSKIFKLCGNNDTVTMVVQDDADVCDFCFENTSSEKVSDFQLRLIDIEAESLGIPEQEYSSVVRMPSKELMSICRDLNTFGDTVLIGVTKEGIKFSVKGSMGSGNVTLKVPFLILEVNFFDFENCQVTDPFPFIIFFASKTIAIRRRRDA